MNFVKLSDQIAEYFNAEELKDLCFRLGISYDNLAGETNAGRARELTDYCRRRGRINDLMDTCRQLRPHVLWVDADMAAREGTEQTGFSGPPAGGQASNVPAALPIGPQPPQVPGMFWMPYPNTWYGPIFGYFIGWMSFGGFQVWHPMMGSIAYPDPYHQIQRNMWIRLFNSPFNVYVDGGPSGYVYAQYAPV